MTDLDIELPTEGDVVELILSDHRRFEELLRDLRDDTNDRDAVRRTLATLHVAHAEAEEQEVYPTLRKDDAISGHDAHHGKEEHAEGNQALLAVLEATDTTTDHFEDLVEELARLINHHLTEEELSILNPARDEVGDEERARLGTAFLRVRNKLVESDGGDVETVRKLVADAKREGLLEGEDD
jgi:hypothetical protein